MKYAQFLAVAVVAAFFLGGQSVQAAPASGNTMPTNITADHLRYSADQQKVIFEGNVHVVREDFDMVAEKMTVLLKKSPAAQASPSENGENIANDLSAGELHEIIAERNVVFKSKQKEARAQKARYQVDLDRITLEGGPPKPWLKDYENDRTVTGDILHHYINEGRSEGSSVNMTFTTQDKSPKKPRR